jgi:hypothetical protein
MRPLERKGNGTECGAEIDAMIHRSAEASDAARRPPIGDAVDAHVAAIARRGRYISTHHSMHFGASETLQPRHFPMGEALVVAGT